MTQKDLFEEFAQGPEAGLPPEGVVVRPSLLAAADVPFKFLGGLLFLVLPFLVAGGIAAGPRLEAQDWVELFFLVDDLFNYVPLLFLPLLPGIRLIFTRYVLTEDALIVRTQVLARTEQRVQWPKVTALRHRRTFVDRLLGIERLDVVAYGVRGTTVQLVGLRGAAPLRSFIAQKMRESATVENLFAND